MPSVRLELTTFRLWDWRANQLRQEGFEIKIFLADSILTISSKYIRTRSVRIYLIMSRMYNLTCAQLNSYHDGSLTKLGADISCFKSLLDAEKVEKLTLKLESDAKTE